MFGDASKRKINFERVDASGTGVTITRYRVPKRGDESVIVKDTINIMFTTKEYPSAASWETAGSDHMANFEAWCVRNGVDFASAKDQFKEAIDRLLKL